MLEASAAPLDAPAADAAPGPDELLRRLGASGARDLYDALIRLPGSKPELEQRLDVVAAPNDRAEDLRAGDLFVRAALGEGHALLAVLVTGELLDRRTAERRGWQLEGTLPGRYAHVVEGGVRPHEREEDWARRIADGDLYLPAGHAVLRLKSPLSESRAVGPAPGETAEITEGVNERSGAAYARWYQDALNHIDRAGLGVDGDVGPLTRAAVRRFQQRSGLPVDGIVGSQTEHALMEQGASAPPGYTGPPVAPAATRATFILLQDADRDGTVDGAPGAATWTWGPSGRGAVVLVNNDDDGVDGRPDNADSRIDGGNDARDLAPLTIARTTAGPPPAGTQVELMVDPPGVLRILSGRAAGGAEVIGPATAASFRLPNLAPARFEFAMEALRYAGTGFSGEVRITLRVTDPGGAHTDSPVVIRVAPWLMPNHLTRAERVFVASLGSFNSVYRTRLRTLVAAAGCQLIEIPATDDRWIQDCMEFGFASLPGGALRTVVPSPQERTLKTVAPSLLSADLGVAHVGSSASKFITFDSGGNLECSPPVKSAAGKRYPFGRIYFGPGQPSEPIDPDLAEFLRRQVVQEPIEVDTQWLYVGHVDEILSFVPVEGAKGFKMVIASTRLAYAILDALNASNPGARMLLGRSFPYPGHPASPVEQTVNAFLSLRDDFLPEMRNNIAAHTVSYTPKPLRDYNADRQRDLDGVKATMKTELGLADSDIIELPSLFMPSPRPLGMGLADALTGGLANMLVLNRHCILPKPFGPQGGRPSGDLFERDVRSKLAPLTVSFLDCWYEYHVALGGVHCSTNTLRTATPARWWEFQP